MRFSFVTTCRNRLHDLQATLSHNLDLLRDGDEVVVLAYHCPPTADWLFNGPLHGHSLLRPFAEVAAPRFFMAHAKNVAHLLARGDVIVNLDADNFLSPGYLDVLRNTDWYAVDMLYPRHGSGGFKGRVAVRRNAFLALGGYDEAMDLGYGYEEIDLYRRLKACGRYRVADVNIQAVTDPMHSSKRTLLCIPTADAAKAAGQKDPRCPTFLSEKRHRAISDANLKARRFGANAGRPWGAAVVYDAAGRRREVGEFGVSTIAPERVTG